MGFDVLADFVPTELRQFLHQELLSCTGSKSSRSLSSAAHSHTHYSLSLHKDTGCQFAQLFLVCFFHSQNIKNSTKVCDFQLKHWGGFNTVYVACGLFSDSAHSVEPPQICVHLPSSHRCMRNATWISNAPHVLWFPGTRVVEMNPVIISGSTSAGTNADPSTNCVRLCNQTHSTSYKLVRTFQTKL